MIQVSSPYSVPPPPIPQASSNAHLFQPIQFKPFKPPDGEFDGKRLRKSVMRKTVDYNSSVVQMLEARLWQKDERARLALPPDICFASEILPPPAYLTNPINAVVTKFVRTSTNKAKCPIFCLAWTPEGRRLVTGASSGEFTLWNGLTFNFETILQAHESSVRAMVWSHNDQWMVTGDTSGYVKYWQTNMNNVKMFQAHKDPVRGLSFSPSDQKIATGSDDGTVRIWDFFRCQEERVLRGHGADVKCVDWHPSKSLLASGSKDNQQPIKLWDPRTGTSLAKLHAHKSTVMDLKWNANGTWLCSASRDHLLKLFDIRNFSTELQIFRGHKKEASSIAWHPQHEGLFSSGGSDGSILFWHVGNDKEVGAIESAHDGIIWDMAWHPLGHLLCSGSNDHTSKFWTRNRPGDKMRDKYNLNTLPPGVVGDDCVDIDDIPVSASYIMQPAIPGMGPDDKVEAEPEPKGPETIPGLEFDSVAFAGFLKKTPYAKPIPKTFQAAWNAAGGLEEDMEDDQSNNWVIVESESLFSKPAITEGDAVVTDFGEQLPPGSVPLSEIKADAIAYYGFYIPLPAVPGDVIQDAFAFNEEEEALAEITSDVDFARKLIREKRGLYNPSQGGEDSKDDRPEKKFTPKDSQRGNFNKGNNHFHGNFNGRIHPDGMPPQHFNGPPGQFNAGPPGPFNNGPPGPFNNGPPGPFNNGPPAPFNNGPQGQFNNAMPGQFNNGPPGMFNNGPPGRPGNFAPNHNFNQNNFASNDFNMPNLNMLNPNISNMPNPNIHLGNANNNIMQGSPHSDFNRRNGPSQRFPNQESRGEDREQRGNFRENDRNNRFPLRDGENDRDGRFPPRDGGSDRGGHFPSRDLGNERDGRFSLRDGENDRDGRFTQRDSGNDRDGRFPPRDGQNNRDGRFLPRDGVKDREGRFPDRDSRISSREGGNDREGRFPPRDGGSDRDFNFENSDRNFFRDGEEVGDRMDRDFRDNDSDKDRIFNRSRNREGEEFDRGFRKNEHGDRGRERGDRSGRWPSGEEEDRHWRDKRGDFNEGDDHHSKGDWGGKRGMHGGRGRTRGPWRDGGQRRNF